MLRSRQSALGVDGASRCRRRSRLRGSCPTAGRSTTWPTGCPSWVTPSRGPRRSDTRARRWRNTRRVLAGLIFLVGRLSTVSRVRCCLLLNSTAEKVVGARRRPMTLNFLVSAAWPLGRRGGRPCEGWRARLSGPGTAGRARADDGRTTHRLIRYRYESNDLPRSRPGRPRRLISYRIGLYFVAYRIVLPYRTDY